MLQRILKLLDSFKENQVSKILQSNRQMMVTTLLGPHFSNRIKPYFATINENGVPFTDFASQPKQVAQIKEVMNALYHAEQAFLDLESIKLDVLKTKATIKNIYYHMIHHAYQASYLLTHLDVELSEIFANEIKLLLPIFSSFQQFAESHEEDAAAFTEQIKQYPIGYQAGLISGIAVDQMNPSNEEIDYSFLTQFSAVLPGYIQQFTGYIQQYSPQQLANFQPTLDQEKLNALQSDGFKLLSSLENLRGEGFFLSAKIVYYVDILERVIRLSMSTLEQMANLNESSQDVIRDNLTLLKDQLLVSLLGLADRVEDETLLAAGTISKPLMAGLKPLYQLLILYTSKVVNFSDKGQELLTIEDDQFINLRLEETEQRINKAKRNLLKIEQAQADFKVFFKILEKPRYKDNYLIGLSTRTKNALANHYRLLEPYLKKLDFDTNNNIIKALTQDNLWLNSVNPWHLLPSAHEKLTVTQVLLLKEKIATALEKEANTQRFHLALNEDLVESVHENAELSLFPSKGKTKLFACDETLVLKIDRKLANNFDFQIHEDNCLAGKTDDLSSDQSFELHQFYADKLTRLARARTAYERFMSIIHGLHPKSLQQIDPDRKTELRKQYCRFQPYMVEILAKEKSYDELIVAVFSENPVIDSNRDLSTDYFILKEKILLSSFRHQTNWFQERSVLYQDLAGKRYRQTEQKRVLKPENSPNKRGNYLLEHTEYSKAISEARTAVSQLISLFNKAAQKQLKPAISTSYLFDAGPPFPNIKDRNGLVAQSKQLLSIMEISNSLYHLEHIGKQLEKLNNKSTETVYVYHLVRAYSHIDGLVDAAKQLRRDPYLALIASGLSERVSKISEALLQRSEPYRMDHRTIDLTRSAAQATASAQNSNNEITYNGIWYPLNAFLLIPAQICALTAETTLTAQELNTIQANAKQVVLDIESVIASTSSYFRLFLKTPVMYRLFKDLQEKLNQFTTLSHGTVLSHLKEINTELLTQILLETDEWEDRIGLQPGQLSGPMKLLLDEFYKGLIEPLGLISQKHLELISTVEPIDRRIAEVKTRKLKAKTDQNKYKSDCSIMEKLMEAIRIHNNFNTPPYPSPPAMYAAEQKLVKCYKKALPILNENKDLFTLLTGELEQSPKIDRLIAREVVEPLELHRTSRPTQPRIAIAPKKYVGDALPQDPRSPFSQGPEEDQNRILNAPDGRQPIENASEIDQSQLGDTNVAAHCRLIFNHCKGLIATQELDIQTASDHSIMEKLMEAIRVHTNFNTPPCASLPAMYKADQELVECYKNALPILNKNKNLFALLTGELEQSPKIDRLITRKVLEPIKLQDPLPPFSQDPEEDQNRILNAPDGRQPIENASEIDQSQLGDTNVAAHCRLIFNHCKGLIATQELNIQTAEEKERYLNTLREKQLRKKEQLVVDFAQMSINKQIEAVLRRQLIGLASTPDEYRTLLVDYLESWNEKIIDATKTSADITNKVNEIISEKTLSFDRYYYRQYAHLESVIVALTQFKTYCTEAFAEVHNEDSTFESAATLRNKARLIQQLEGIAQNSRLTVKERFQHMQAIAETPEFKKIILECSEPQLFTLAWLNQLVSSFLQLLNLYTPEHVEYYEALNQALTTPPDRHTVNRYRYFETPQVGRRYALPQLAFMEADDDNPDLEEESIELGS